MPQERDYTSVVAKREVPAFLRQQRRFNIWSLKPNPGGRPTKSPDNPRSPADLANALWWNDVKDLPRTRERGIGYMLVNAVKATLQRREGGTTEATMLLLDIDACRDPSTREIAPWAIEIIEQFDCTWTEVTPSGTGLRSGIFVVNMPKDFTSKVKVPHPAMPNTGGKKPELQIFGRGVAEYVTLTGDRLQACSEKLVVVDNIDWLLDRFNMHISERANADKLPVGVDEIPDLSEITKHVERMPHGKALVQAHWKEVLPNKSASEAFHLLAGHALHAAHGHGEQAVNWLLDRTAWGHGMVDSADPAKYCRRSWVEKDVIRASARVASAKAADVFTDLTGDLPAPEQQGRLRPWQDVADDPPVEWLVDGILPKRAAVLLAGDPGAGKTLLAFDIALHQAHGLPWMGRKTQPSSTLFLAGEGFGGLGARLRAWKLLHPDAVMQPGCYVAIFDGVPNLTGETGIEELAALVQEAKDRFGSKPDCVTLDTLAAANPGGDENSVEGIGLVMNTLAELRRVVGCTTTLLHHLRKGEPGSTPSLHSLRGSTGIPGAVDVALIAAEDAGAYALYTVKVRDGAETKTPYDIEGVTTGRARSDGQPETGPAVKSFSVKNKMQEADEATIRMQREEDAVVEALRELGTVSAADTLVQAARLKAIVGRAAVDRAISKGRILRSGPFRQRTFKLSPIELLAGGNGTSRDGTDDENALL